MSPRKSGSEKTRFTLWLPDNLMERLTRIQQAHAKESLAEVVRDGLMVYVDLLKAREEGADLFFQDAGDGGADLDSAGAAPQAASKELNHLVFFVFGLDVLSIVRKIIYTAPAEHRSPR